MKENKRFNYSDLSFIYIACLISIALVYSLFQVRSYYLERQVEHSLSTIQKMEDQQDLLAHFEHLVALTQNRTSPEYRQTTDNLAWTLSRLENNQDKLAKQLKPVALQCRERVCRFLFRDHVFNLHGAGLLAALSSNKLDQQRHSQILHQLYNEAEIYRLAVGDGQDISYALIHSRRREIFVFDLTEYLSLLMLLLVQAIYVFRPAIRRLKLSLATRSDFLSRISHEIRNPMNSIIGMADILEGTHLNAEQQQYVTNLLSSGHALLDMLNNLIDFSVIEVGKLTLRPAPFHLFNSVDRCLNLVAVQAHHKGLNLYVKTSASVCDRLIGDSVRLEQVILNLLNNAVKFTECGSVTLAIEVIKDQVHTQTFAISVEDTGIGIREDQLNEIFESFVQADSSIQRRYGGSGLGLSISTEIIRRLGSELKVESQVGKGSKFYFNLTLEKESECSLYDLPLHTLKQRHFVFVTSRDEAPHYEALMSPLELRFNIVSSPSELQQVLAKRETVEEILIDDSVGIVSMITCRNQADMYGAAGSAVALLRSNFAKENMDLLKKNGFTRYLIKPLRPWELRSLPGEPQAAPLNAGVDGGAEILNRLKARRLRFLLVDDSDDNLFLLREIMNPIAAEIQFASNGLEAIEKFKEGKFDLVFMDIQMPVMDGYTAIRKIRENESGKNKAVPVFAVTAHSGLVDAQRCREAGFTDRIVKPLVRRDIYTALARAFGIAFSEVDAENVTGLPPNKLSRLLPIFFKTKTEDVTRLKSALSSLDFEAVVKTAHKIKGSSASYGFPGVADLGSALETSARGKDLESCLKVMHDLEDMLKQRQREAGL